MPRPNRAGKAITHLCAPPFVPALAIEAGFFVRHGRFLTEFNWQTLGHEIHHRLLDYLLGSLIVGPILVAVAITLTTSFQNTQFFGQIQKLKILYQFILYVAPFVSIWIGMIFLNMFIPTIFGLGMRF